MKIQVICLKNNKKGNFKKGNSYKGVTFNYNNLRLIGEDGKNHIVKLERFIIIKIGD